MKKFSLLLLILMTVGLVGCLPRAQVSPTSTFVSTPTALAPTLAQSTPTVELKVPTQPPLQPDSGCTVISRKPTPGPTVESIYPPVTTADHVKGPQDASITIIEYSDFQ